jgi:chromate reductase, NAD(P)H dehydrogenase (quinone)
MSKTKVAVFVGSLRKDSINKKLAKAVEKLMPADYEFEYVDIGELPLYNQDYDADYPAPYRRLKQQIEGADALLFVTPEYNRSVPGVLKNAIDIGSRPWGKNSFAGKPAAVIGASIGTIGTAIAQQHVRGSLAFVDAPTLAQPEVFIHFKEGLFDDEGDIGPDETRKFLQGFVGKYVDWVAKHRS